MGAARYNIQIDQGSDWSIELEASEEGIPVDLTGYSARSEMRTKKDPDIVAGSFVCSIPNPLSGVVIMSLPNADSTAMAPGIYEYDLEIYTPGDAQVTRLLEGKVDIDSEVTQ